MEPNNGMLNRKPNQTADLFSLIFLVKFENMRDRHFDGKMDYWYMLNYHKIAIKITSQKVFLTSLSHRIYGIVDLSSPSKPKSCPHREIMIDKIFDKCSRCVCDLVSKLYSTTPQRR